MLVDEPPQRLAPQELHHHVGGVVLLERAVDVDDAGVVEPSEDAGFVEELGPGAGIVSGAEPAERMDVGAAAGRAVGEELLDGDRAAGADVAAEIGDPEAALAEDLADRIDTALELGTGWQGAAKRAGRVDAEGRSAGGAGGGGGGILGVADRTEGDRRRCHRAPPRLPASVRSARRPSPRCPEPRPRGPAR